VRKFHQRRIKIILASASVLVLGSGGCSTKSLAWNTLNPFSANDPAGVTQSSDDSVPKIATASQTVDSEDGVIQGAGFTASAKKAWSSTTSAVTGIFTNSKEEKSPSERAENDPLSLSNQPEKVNAEVYLANGQLWESTGDLGKAMESYTRALTVEPNDSSALKSVARLHFRQQNYADAAKYFQRAATLIPEEAGLQNDLGLTLSKLGQSETAIEHLSKALELSPGNSRYSNNLASVLFDNQEEQAALNILSKNNQPAVAHFNMAYLYLQSGKLVQARKHLSEVMKYEVLAADDVATRRAVDRTREMLAGLDLRDESGPVARTAARPISQVMDKSSSTDGVLSATVPASELNNSSSNVPFALPTGYEINPADSGK